MAGYFGPLTLTLQIEQDMSGETNLKKLLQSMSPDLMEGEYVFCTFPKALYGDHKDLEPIASVQETEGLSLVVPKANADAHNIPYESIFRGISLNVLSSLDAVGLTAALSNKLSEHHISANVVAGFYHDHIFVQKAFAEQALAALRELANESA